MKHYGLSGKKNHHAESLSPANLEYMQCYSPCVYLTLCWLRDVAAIVLFRQGSLKNRETERREKGNALDRPRSRPSHGQRSHESPSMAQIHARHSRAERGAGSGYLVSTVSMLLVLMYISTRYAYSSTWATPDAACSSDSTSRPGLATGLHCRDSSVRLQAGKTGQCTRHERHI